MNFIARVGQRAACPRGRGQGPRPSARASGQVARTRPCDLSARARILFDVSASSFAIDVPQSLIKRLRAADMQALEQVYRLFERPVYALAARMLGDADEAREVLHDALLQVFDKIGQFRGDSPFWGWLRQIAVNEVLMRLRKRKLDYVDELPEPEHVLRALDVSVGGIDLERALTELSPLTRSVLWLYFVEGYTHDEIARAFDKTVSFSKTQVSRGTEKLRDLLHSGKESMAYA